MSLRIHFQDLPHSDSIKDECERRVGDIETEFPETSKIEVTVSHAKGEHETHVHITGKELELAASARNRELLGALEEAFDKLHRQLRKHHDKQIFGRRRDGKSSRHADSS